jgi:hypothetical protein
MIWVKAAAFLAREPKLEPPSPLYSKSEAVIIYLREKSAIAGLLRLSSAPL